MCNVITMVRQSDRKSIDVIWVSVYSVSPDEEILIRKILLHISHFTFLLLVKLSSAEMKLQCGVLQQTVTKVFTTIDLYLG